MNRKNRAYLVNAAKKYRSCLTENILPFWMEHGVDYENGGIYTCLDRDGSVMDTTKSVWFQGRWAYIAAHAYNVVEKNQEWLDASLNALIFIQNNCIDTDNHMFFTVTADGQPVQKRRYVFSECFAAMAMAEYAKATGSEEWAQKALDMYLNIKRLLTTEGLLQPKTTVKGYSHSITMMLINVVGVIRQVIDHPALEVQVWESVDIIENKLMHPEFEALLESCGEDGELIDTIAGRVINPGHCIETSWFLLREAERRGWDPRLTRLGVQIFDWSWKWGWDDEFGGIINFKDCKNFPAQDYSQDMKFWWPQCEAIIATLMCYRATHDEKYLDLYRKIDRYAFKVLPDREYPEWYGYLHRDGTVAQPAKGNIFKGPFHIPRMLIEAEIFAKDILFNEKNNK